MFKSKKFFIILPIVVIIPLIMAFALTPKPASAKTKLSVSGAWALYPMMTVWAEEYEKIHKDISISVFAGGAGKGSTDALAGIVDIAMISREAHKDELDKGGVFIPAAKDAVVATINAKNPVLEQLNKKGMTKEVFQRLYLKGDIKTWGAAVGTSANNPMHVYTRSDSCGAAESWAKYLGAAQEDLKGTGVYGDPGLLKAVQDDHLAIGYNNYSYVFDRKTGNMNPGISVISIDVNENGVIDKNEKIVTRNDLQTAIKTGLYPHPPARLLYLMTKGEPKGPAKDFILWILTDGQKLVDDAGFMKVPDDILKKNLDILYGKATRESK